MAWSEAARRAAAEARRRKKGTRIHPRGLTHADGRFVRIKVGGSRTAARGGAVDVTASMNKRLELIRKQKAKGTWKKPKPTKQEKIYLRRGYGSKYD